MKGLIIGLSLIVISIVFIIIMAPHQVIRDDYMGWMSQYTAAGALGVIIGIYLVINAFVPHNLVD